jgi:DNA-binding GntR family transcriptional regulator
MSYLARRKFHRALAAQQAGLVRGIRCSVRQGGNERGSSDMSQTPTGASAFTPLETRPDNLATMVYAQIRDRIIDATLAPGSSVSEASLATQLNVSKTPVREALLRLRHIGLVEPTTRGLRVIEPSARMIRDAFELRADLEAAASRDATERGDEAARSQIAGAASDSLDAARADHRADFLTHDRSFHMAITAAAGNEVLLQTMENVFSLTQALRQRDVELEREFVTDAEEHVAIAEAIRSGDRELAQKLSAAHIRRIMGQLLEAFAEGGKQRDQSGS